MANFDLLEFGLVNILLSFCNIFLSSDYHNASQNVRRLCVKHKVKITSKKRMLETSLCVLENCLVKLKPVLYFGFSNILYE